MVNTRLKDVLRRSGQGHHHSTYIMHYIASVLIINASIFIKLTVCQPTEPTIDAFYPSDPEGGDSCGDATPLEGQSTCMDCLIGWISTTEDHEVQWWTDDGELLSVDDYIADKVAPRLSLKLISGSHERHGGDYQIYRLWITNVTRLDTGKYTCQLTYTNKSDAKGGGQSSASKELALTVRFFPSEGYPLCSSATQPLVFKEGENMQFSCLSELSEPLPEIKWSYEIKTAGGGTQQFVVPGNNITDETYTYNNIHDSAASVYDFVTFVCEISSTAFPGRASSCSVGPLRVLTATGESQKTTPVSATKHRPTPISTTLSPNSIGVSKTTTGVSKTTTDADVIVTDVVTSFQQSTELDYETGGTTIEPLSTTPLENETPHTRVTVTPSPSHNNHTHKTTIMPSTQYNDNIALTSLHPKNNLTPTNTFLSSEVPQERQSTLTSTLYQEGTTTMFPLKNITSGSGGDRTSPLMKTSWLIVGMAVIIVLFALLLTFVLFRWRKAKEKLKKEGSLTHLHTMSYAELQAKYRDNYGSAYYQEVSDDFPGDQLPGQKLSVTSGTIYDVKTPATLPTSQDKLTNRDYHTYSSLTPPRLPPDRLPAMPTCANPIYEQPYYFKMKAGPEVVGFAGSGQNGGGEVANIMYQSTNNTSIMQPYVEINRNGSRAMEDIYQTLS